MKRYNHYILTALMVWCLLPAYSVLAQQTMIKGSVMDESGTPVEGATITIVQNPANKATSDEKGWFTIEAEMGQHLQVTRESRSGKKVYIDKSDINITLGEGGGEAVPVGYGLVRDKDELTAAVGMTGSKELSESMTINPENALYGRIPGLTVLSNGGLPPTNANLLIRGRGTFGDSSPLVVVDGFEQPLSSLSSNEIESVTLLKDATVLAKYGQRGANGVLLVTTKRGGRHGLQVTASYEQAFTQPTQLPSFLDAPAYARAINEARLNDGLDPRYGAADIDAFDKSSSSYLFPNINWFDKVLRNNGVNSNYNVSFQGGGESVRYFALMNVVFENGLFGPVNRNEDYSTQAKYSRFNFRSNLDIDITDNLLMRLDVSGNIEENNLPGGGGGVGQIFDALYTIPSAAFPVQTPDGSWGGTQIYDNNPVALLTSTGFGQPNTRDFSLAGNFRRDLSQWTEGLSAELTIRYNNFNNFAERKSRSYSYKSFTPVRDQNGTIIDTTSTSYGQETDLDFTSFFSNEREFTDMLGKVNYETNIGDGNTLKSLLLFHQSSRVFDGQDNTFHRQNIVGNVHLGFSGKYFVDMTASYSGSNLLPPGNKFNFYPAVSAGWLISKEDFMEGARFLDRLKLRGSWGISGSDRLPSNNLYEQAYHGAPGYWFRRGNNYRPGFAEGRLASSDFTSETSYKTNIGIDATLFGKLDVATDLFYERRTNILTSTNGSVSQVIGIAPPLETDGIVENKGIEASIGWQDIIGEVGYHIGGQFSFAQNKILDMNETYRPYDYLRRTGRSVGQWFGMEAIGFFQDEADIANSPRQLFSDVQPGDIKYKDQNGDGIINEFDEVPLGHASGYPEIYFSASLGVNYKGFSISALLQGTGNYTAYLNTKSVFWPIRDNNTISEYYYARRWTPQTANSATLPRLTTETNNNNFRPNSLWLADRSYVKLRTLEVSYSLPASLVQTWSMRNVKILGRGMNLFSIDNIPVLDPENLSARYPILRSYHVGLEIAF